jgi:hypothetical protein
MRTDPPSPSGGIELYVRETSEAAVRGVADGEVEMSEPVTQEALTAVGISCGIALRGGLDREARGALAMPLFWSEKRTTFIASAVPVIP